MSGVQGGERRFFFLFGMMWELSLLGSFGSLQKYKQALTVKCSTLDTCMLNKRSNGILNESRKRIECCGGGLNCVGFVNSQLYL